MLDKLILKYVGPILDKAGTGWKTAFGAIAWAVITVLYAMNKITPEQKELYSDLAVGLFAVGLFHKTTTNAQEIKTLKEENLL